MAKSESGEFMSVGNQHVSLDDIAGRLVSAFEPCTETVLPSGKNVIALARQVRELLFPGYHSSRRVLDDMEQIHESTELLRQIEVRLRIEVGRALEHDCQAHLKIHSVHHDSDRTGATLTREFLATLPSLRQTLMTDIRAAFDGDPAARTCDEILLCYPGIEAIFVYRIAHELHRLGIPYLPRILTESAHRKTGIDIHPAAKIGPHFFIDHGTGVVIGETAEIGRGVTLYQGVTLGAWSFPRDDDGNLIRGAKRHPTLEDDVTVYSNATILGGTTVVGAGSQIGSSVTLSRSVGPRTIVTIEKPSLRIREAG